ncbi:MAG: SDR family NAD(P)-dependent oxidoreductase [Actinomycetota bacterium]
MLRGGLLLHHHAGHDLTDRSVAIVTGGASGIGRALVDALVRRGASVVLADLDGDRAEIVAKEIDPDRVTASQLDVRDAAAVRSLVEATAEQRGRLDILCNNAGIGVGGNLEDLTLEHWDRIVDVNLRGVINGVMAAYPVMLRQGRGHILNTASMAGLVPTGMLTPYATTKFAVVGLSLSLRSEAAGKGVRVSVLCPGPVNTPLLDSTGPEDLPRPASLPNARRFLTRRAPPCSPERVARAAMKGLERNVPVIVVPWWIKPGWALMRLSPRLLLRMAEGEIRSVRRTMA